MKSYGGLLLLFTVQELATAVELELPLPIVLWNNDGLGAIRAGMDDQDIPQIAVNPRNPDFIMMAKSFGCHTAQPDSLDAFQEALGAAFTADAPTLIEIRQDAPYLGGGSA